MSDWLDGLPQVPMTASPNVAKKPAKKTPEKGDLGKQLGYRAEQKAADKIVDWQESGGGVVQAEDAVVVVVEAEEGDKKKDAAEIIVNVGKGKTASVLLDDKNKENEGASKTAGEDARGTQKAAAAKRRTSREIDVEKKAWVRRKSKPQAEIEEDLKHVGTPKKRVVSDGHWRKDRSPVKKEVATPEKDLTPKPLTIRRSNEIKVGLKVPPSVQSFVEDEVPRVKAVRRVSRSPSQDRERASTPRKADYEDDGVKVYINKRRRRSKPLIKELLPEETTESAQSEGRTGSTETRPSSFTTPDPSPPKKILPDKQRTTSRAKSPRQSLTSEDGPIKERRPSGRKTRSPVHDSEERLRLAKAAQSYQRDVKVTPEPVRSSAPPAAPQVHGSRIEGWLAGMSDPFTEVVEPALGAENDSRSGSRKSGQVDEDDRDQDDAGRGKGSGRRKHSSRKASLEQLDGSDDAFRRSSKSSPRPPHEDELDGDSALTPTLKRNGARRNLNSPTKDRAKSPAAPGTIMEEDDASSLAQSTTDLPIPNIRRRTYGARPFPSTGKRLSTIASVETFNMRPYPHPPAPRSEASDHQTVVPDGSVISRASDGDVPHRQGSGLKRRLTKHSDLISVLSLPRGDQQSIVSARSIRTTRAKTGSATVGDIMNEVSTDELKYQRELRTLIDGVIPVLLSCVLSKSDSAVAAGLFSRSAKDDPRVTQPIIDMGIALERLKSTHRRIPMHDADALLTWAQSAAKVYADYLKAWRLGFQDVVVNLAPATEKAKKDLEWDDGLPRNEDGDLLDGDGERVDVAYLLKRPLVRLKYLAKSFKSLDRLSPSVNAEETALKYQELVQEARKRSNEERARLEDEAAANIDPTKARDPRSLAPLAGVSIDPRRLLRARDYFDMDLMHSTGQQLVCKVELLFRDDAPGRGDSGDVLICEITTTGRWLLFPPVRRDLISARNGNKHGEIVVMMRGMASSGQEWREIMSLQSDEEQTGLEWVQMLGLLPVPPSLSRKSSFNRMGDNSERAPVGGNLGPGVKQESPGKSRTPSPREVEIPIGEQAKGDPRNWPNDQVHSRSSSRNNIALPPTSEDRTRHQKRNETVAVAKYASAPTTPLGSGDEFEVNRSEGTLRRAKAKRYRSTPSSPLVEESSRQLYFEQEEKQQRRSLPPKSPPHSRPGSAWSQGSSYVSQPKKEYSVWLPSSDVRSDGSEEGSDEEQHGRTKTRPKMHRRTSSVPSLEMPTIPKIRKASEPNTPLRSHQDGYQRAESAPSTPTHPPTSAPAKLQKRRPSSREEEGKAYAATSAPQPPSHKVEASRPLRSSNFPSFTPAFMKKTRRSSSPLKHEYEPSTATESSSDSDASDLNDDESMTSESSGDEGLDVLGELKPMHLGPPPRQHPKRTSPPESLFSGQNASLSPSQSASQAPYRTVPQQAGKASRVVASIFSWSDRGSWDSLHPHECSVIVTPGLIEAFDISTVHAHSITSGESNQPSPSTRGIQALVALELTPLVPLRRGTALDISIRSPPTVNSKIRAGNNVMFRSRSPEECEALYALINRARINNPTYMALQNARGPVNESNWGATMDRRNSMRANSASWWHVGSRKSSTYRSSGSRPASVAATDSSIGTMNTAFSALRRFSGGSRLFNIARSTITSVDGSRSGTSETLSSGSSTPMVLDPRMGTPLGITNAKIRLYTRETTSKWRDMGSARLTILIPPRPDPSIPANPRTTGLQKRILINGKTKGETLLDVTLGESSFERVARTGIAVSVWEESTGPNGEIGQVAAVGGVSSARARVFMLQMKSERDCAYTFGLVGKLRY